MSLQNEHKIGDTISELREQKGWTQRELAEKLEVTDKAVCKWESNKGVPSLPYLTAIAELFDISLDYLLTGKEKEDKIIAISKLELCAKNDDPALLVNFGANSKDENGKSLMDYIKQYNSLKVLKALFDRCPPTNYISLFNHGNFIDLNKCADEILLLMHINCERKYIQEVCRNNVSIYNVSDIDKNGYLKIIKYLIKNYEKLPQDQKEYYFGAETILKPKKAWIFAFPYFLDISYKTKKKVFNELLAKVIATNDDYNIDNKRLHEWAGNYYDQHFAQWKEHHCYIDILQSTVMQAFKNGETELGNQLNSYCKNKLTNYQIYALAIDNDSKLSQKEKDLKLCLHGGILNIDKLLATKDCKLIKESIFKYPTSYIEIFYTLIQKKDYRELFHLAVDMDIDSTSIRNGQIDKFSELVAKEFWINYKPASVSWGKREVDEFKKSQEPNMKYFQEQKQVSYDVMNIGRTRLKIEDCMQKIKEGKDKILENLSFEQEKIKLTKNLTKDFFIKELDKGNIDRVVINLCVKLEAILKYQYKLEGDFQEMLDKFTDKINDSNMATLLNKLRMFRNKIVHAVTTDIDISKDELKKCIEYICKLDDKE